MITNELEVLLDEDSPEDAALALRALRKNNLINKIHVAISLIGILSGLVVMVGLLTDSSLNTFVSGTRKSI